MDKWQSWTEDLNEVKKTIDTYSGSIFQAGLILVILSGFFLFLNLFTDSFDTPKFLALLIFVSLLLIILTLKFTLAGKVTLVRTPLDIPLLLLLAAGIASTVLSPAPFVSLLGNQLKISNSLISLIVYVLFYFLLVNNLTGAKNTKRLINFTVFAGQILALVTLLSYAGIKLLPPWTDSFNFTPTGSSFSTAAVLTLLLPFIIIPLLSATKPLAIITNSVFLLISGLTIALIGSWPVWTAALASLALSLYLSGLGGWGNLGKIKPIRLIGLAVPAALIVLILALSLIPPIGKAQNPVYTRAQNFPREIQPTLVTSWKVAVSAFRDSPVWGSGIGTYAFDFTNYKPVEFNLNKFWNIRFDNSFNEYLQVLATLGGIGLFALVSLTVLFASSAYRVIAHSRSPQSPQSPSLLPTLAISGLVFFVILLLHPASLTVWIIGILILAAFMRLNLSEGSPKSWLEGKDLKSKFLQIAANVTSYNPSREIIRVDALPGILLVISISLVLSTFFFGGKMVLADYHHRLALNAVAQNQGILAYNELVAAEKLNPYADTYRLDLAQTNFALANAIAAAKGPTEASPGGSLTDQDKQNIQMLLQQSINEGRTATTLSPRSAVNWEVLALLYRQISGVAQNALLFSLDSYGRAIFQDPLNPQLRVSVGGVYYAVKNYDMAIRFFTDAVNLKPDFANAYFNLSVALRDKGDLNGAKAMAEKLLSLVEQSSPDYKTASDYLKELNDKIAAGSTPAESEQAPAQPPAAQANGALEKKELPKVINLPKPEKIATPEAIKKPEATPSANP